jgi:RNA 2',3'-cyclic 3'-phosphodiesterase
MVAQEQVRCFVAIALPQDLIERLRELQHEIRSGLPDAKIKWVKPENLHLTLRFLGGVRLADMDRLGDGLQRVCERHAPFRLNAAGLGCFPNPRRPRVLWVGLGGDLDALKKLQRDIDAVSAPFGEHKETKTYNPHLTLARLDGLPLQLPAGPSEMGQWRVEEAHLMKSTLLRTGAVYEPVRTVRLTG